MATFALRRKNSLSRLANFSHLYRLQRKKYSSRLFDFPVVVWLTGSQGEDIGEKRLCARMASARDPRPRPVSM
jgi:hypothetical protein